ncbi:MAG TPA: hypothetical protein VFM51_02150 [Solirubrobacterales bacterium]|nr:hypothetical protein [Solirubrobacterales bacterium]
MGKRSSTLTSMLVLGLASWLAGVRNLFDKRPLLSLAVLIGGGLLTVIAGFLLMASRPSGRLDYGREEVTWFCATFGIGFAFLGLAISPLTHWVLPALVFAAGGLALMAWAPHALGRNRI